MPPNRHPATREGREWMPRGHPEGFTRSMRHPSHRAGSTRAAQTQSAQARHPGPYPPHPTRINGATKDQKREIKKRTVMNKKIRIKMNLSGTYLIISLLELSIGKEERRRKESRNFYLYGEGPPRR